MTINKQKAINKIHLEDTKVFIDIEIISKKTLKIPYKTFIKKLDKFLIKFTDPIEEIKEACDLAFAKGYVIVAKFENKIVGFLILNKMNFKHFFPKYHLSYLAVSSDFKGHGLATLLLEKAILLSKGDLSLHVGIDNKRAIKIYEKMGFRKKYFRMIYQELES